MRMSMGMSMSMIMRMVMTMSVSVSVSVLMGMIVTVKVSMAVSLWDRTNLPLGASTRESRSLARRDIDLVRRHGSSRCERTLSVLTR